MSERLILERWTERGPIHGWVAVGRAVFPTTAPGSVTSQGEVEEVYLFGWIDRELGVWRSVAGVHLDVENERIIETVGLELVGRPKWNHPVILDTVRDGRPLRLRLRLLGF